MSKFSIAKSWCFSNLKGFLQGATLHMQPDTGGHYMMYQGGDSVFTSTVRSLRAFCAWIKSVVILGQFLVLPTKSSHFGFWWQMSHERDTSCPVCSRVAIDVRVSREMLLRDFIEVIKADSRLRCKDPVSPSQMRFPTKPWYNNTCERKFFLIFDVLTVTLLFMQAISAPSAEGNNIHVLYQPHIAALLQHTKPNLEKTLGELLIGLGDGVELTVDDPNLAAQKQLKILWAQ